MNIDYVINVKKKIPAAAFDVSLLTIRKEADADFSACCNFDPTIAFRRLLSVLDCFAFTQTCDRNVKLMIIKTFFVKHSGVT